MRSSCLRISSLWRAQTTWAKVRGFKLQVTRLSASVSNSRTIRHHCSIAKFQRLVLRRPRVMHLRSESKLKAIRSRRSLQWGTTQPQAAMSSQTSRNRPEGPDPNLIRWASHFFRSAHSRVDLHSPPSSASCSALSDHNRVAIKAVYPLNGWHASAQTNPTIHSITFGDKK